MKISGFSFARNADKYYFPVAEAIRSILPICDEFVIAVGKGDGDDRTREIVSSIGDPRIRIIDTVWPDRDNCAGHVYAQQTDCALRQCTGDWCFYIQSDEAVHEKFLPAIQARCARLLKNEEVEGLLFRYRHFWGDYDHCQCNHKWYPREIRIIRNGRGIQSNGDAQSFRRSGNKLRVAEVDAEIFHYGYVRPPRLMQRRNLAVETIYWGEDAARRKIQGKSDAFDYGSLARVPVFRGTHPAVMTERIGRMNWGDQLQYRGPSKTRFKHDRLKYRLLTFLEQHVMGGRQIGGYRNYVIIRQTRRGKI